MPTPRPYNPKVGDQICTKISEGASLRSILRNDKMPSRPTFYKWIRASETFANQYARACEDRADAIFDDMFDIADDASNDMTRDAETGQERLNSEHVQRSRLRIDTRKWALARMAPKKYGDKMDVNHGGNLSINLPGHAKDL